MERPEVDLEARECFGKKRQAAAFQQSPIFKQQVIKFLRFLKMISNRELITRNRYDSSNVLVMNSWKIIVAGLCFMVLGLPTAIVAQPPAAGGGKPVVVTTSAEPSFRIEPIIQKLSGRAGDLLKFSFVLESGGKASDIRVDPVTLKQYADGTILFDPSLPPPPELELGSEPTFRIEAGKKTTIEGMIRVPRVKSPFHSYGILVRDEGKLSDNPQATSDDQSARAKILFKTQYILRIDVLVEGRKSESTEALQVGNVKCIEVNGRPALQMELNNPTESPFEFSAEIGYAIAGTGMKKKTLPLSTISRRSVQSKERYINRILPGATIILEGFPEDFMLAGEYEAEVSISVLGRAVKKPVVLLVEKTAFSSQDINIREICEGVIGFPAQLQLSQRRGEDRVANFHIENISRRPRKLSFQAVDEKGQKVEDVQIRPAEVVLPKGASRKIALMKNGSKGKTLNRYVTIEVVAEPVEGEQTKVSKLTLAMLSGKEPPAEVELTPLEVHDEAGSLFVRSKVINKGKQHIPLHAEINLRATDTDEVMTFEFGWGRWILPGDDYDLSFPVPPNLPPGNYEVECVIKEVSEEPIMQKAGFKLKEEPAKVGANSSKSTGPALR